MNLGFGDDLWGHDPKMVMDEMACALSSSHPRAIGSSAFS